MRGVHHYKNKKKNVNKNFKSMININNIRINLGYFESEIEAHNAYIIEFNKLMIGVGRSLNPFPLLIRMTHHQ